MGDVFISYKRDERSQASGIARRLRKLGLDVWLDEKIATGTQFDAEIESALRVAKAILVLWSPGSVRSEWVRNETAFGVQQGNLVAIMLSPCELPLAFRSVQYEPIFDKSFKDDHPGWIKVLERIKDLASKRPEIEQKERRQRISRKIGRSFKWLGTWVAGAIPITIVFGYVVRRDNVEPGPFLFSGVWPGQSQLSDRWHSYFFEASGTWEMTDEIAGDKIAAPINYVQLKCQSQWGFCIEANAALPNYGLTSWVELDQ